MRFSFFFLINFFNAVYLVVFRNVRRIPWAFMRCSVKSSTTFHTRTACMSGSTSLPHVGHTSHVKHRVCRCLILLILFLRLLIDGVNLNLIKKLSNAFLIPSCAFLLNFQKKRKVYFPIYITFFADLSIWPRLNQLYRVDLYMESRFLKGNVL